MAISPFERAQAYAEQQRRFQRVFEDALSRGQDPSVVNARPEGMPSAYGLQQYEPGSEFYDQAKAQAVLAQIRQFDPNASITERANQLEGMGGSNWVLSFDQSKLPSLATPEASRHVGSYGSDRLRDESIIFDDPNYGPTTIPQNVKQRDSTWLDIVGPLLVGGFAGLASGGLGFLGNALMKAPRAAAGFFGTAASGQSLTPQQALLLRALAARRARNG